MPRVPPVTITTRPLMSKSRSSFIRSTRAPFVNMIHDYAKTRVRVKPPQDHVIRALAARKRTSYGSDMDASVAPVAEPKRKATYDDVLAAPEHQVAEILDGELFLSPRPASPHARASSRLGATLDVLDGEAGAAAPPGGWIFLFEPELHLGPDVLVPDIAGWRRARMPRIPNAPWLEVSPDWLCETLSPSTACIDRTRKLAIYARERVRHVWLVDPLARTLEVLALDGDRWIVAENHGGEDVIRAAPFAAIEIALSRLWLD